MSLHQLSCFDYGLLTSNVGGQGSSRPRQLHAIMHYYFITRALRIIYIAFGSPKILWRGQSFFYSGESELASSFITYCNTCQDQHHSTSSGLLSHLLLCSQTEEQRTTKIHSWQNSQQEEASHEWLLLLRDSSTAYQVKPAHFTQSGQQDLETAYVIPCPPIGSITIFCRAKNTQSRNALAFHNGKMYQFCQPNYANRMERLKLFKSS